MNNSKRKSDEDLKAEFIAKNGVKKVPSARELAPKISKDQDVEPAQKIFTQISTDPGKKPTLLWVKVKELHINHDYQRTVSSSRGQGVIRGIVEHFKWQYFQPLMLTEREEGGYWVIDGQHRMIAALQCGIDKVPAVLHEGLSKEDQARAFAGINWKRVSVNPLAIHYALLAAGDTERLLLQKCCEKAGVIILRYPKAASRGLKPREMMTVGTSLSVLKRFGPETLVKILTSIRSAYPDEPGRLNRDEIKNRIDRFRPKVKL